VVSAADGSYIFPDLPASNPAGYTVTETQPAAYSPGKATSGTGGGTVAAGGNVVNGVVIGVSGTPVSLTDYLFGELSPAGISGRVFEDLNGNGLADAGDTGIAGVTITVTGTTTLGAPVTLTTTTDGAGNYGFPTLAPGTYTVTEAQPAGYLPGRTSAGTVSGAGSVAGSVSGGATGNVIQSIVLGSGGGSPSNNFAEVRAASLAGRVYLDGNANDALDPGEAGIAGVTVTLSGTDFLGNAVTRSTQTAATGDFAFGGLAPGTYVLAETQPTQFLDGATAAGSAGGAVAANVVSSIALPSGAAAVGYLFGERGAGGFGLSGRVYFDRDGNGVRDAGEPGIAGVGITLTGVDIDGNAVDRRAITAADGSYAFVGLSPSNAVGYTLTESQPSGYAPGAATPGSAGGVAQGGGNVISGIRLDNALAPTATDYDFGEVTAVAIPLLRDTLLVVLSALLLVAGARRVRRRR
jgi:protocatechuate 3,4-dioxygenase beta subunit